MFLRLSLLLTATIALSMPSKIFALESCGSAVNKPGIQFMPKKIISTKAVKVDSDLKEDFIKSLYEAESAARIAILRFSNSKIINGKEFHPDKINDSPSLEWQLNRMVTTSKCHSRKKYVLVSVEFEWN